MNSKEIKNFLKTLVPAGVAVSVTTSPTKNPYICARIRLSDANHYPASFPESFRKNCLAAVYGENSPVAQQVSAGNVNGHSIAMHAHEWDRAVSTFDSDGCVFISFTDAGRALAKSHGVEVEL